MKIVLVGYRGSGKTTVGRILSNMLFLDFVDTDSVIEEIVGESISSFVEKNGWERFREVESEVVKELSKKDNVVIASGGGTFINPENYRRLKGEGTFFVFLDARPETLRKRIATSNRPPLLGSDSVSEVDTVLRKRRPIYTSISDLTVETDDLSPYQVAKKIVEKISASP